MLKFIKYPFGQIDRYLISQMLPRMFGALAITMAALLIERILRLFDLITGQGSDIGPVLTLALSLLPHYIGVALPLAFCIAVLGSLGALAKANEIDALENAGWSMRRIGVPFVVCALVMALFSSFLFGFVQPYSRYAFYEIRHAIRTAGWDGRVEQSVFLDVGEGMTLSVAEVDPGGRFLYNVFLLRQEDEGETVITARRGIVQPSEDGESVLLVLQDGQTLFPKGQRLTFKELPVQREFDMDDNPFRGRGSSHRELTFFELWDQMNPSSGEKPDPRYVVEFHSRLVRALSLVAVALLAVPLGVAGKRQPAWRQVVVALVVLAAYENIIKFIGGLGSLGRIDPVLGLWGLFAVFAAFSLWLYISTVSQGSRTPLRGLLRSMNVVSGLFPKMTARFSGKFSGNGTPS